MAVWRTRCMATETTLNSFQGAHQIELWPIEKLIPYARNPRNGTSIWRAFSNCRVRPAGMTCLCNAIRETVARLKQSTHADPASVPRDYVLALIHKNIYPSAKLL